MLLKNKKKSWLKIIENQTTEKKYTKYKTIDEVISLLADVRTDLHLLKKTIESKDMKLYLKHAIQGIDIVGCELTQNIAKLLKEKREKQQNKK